MKISYVKQTDLNDCGVSCLMSIVMYYGGYVRREYLREITKTTSQGVSVYSLVECAKYLGLEAKAIKGDINNIETKDPFIAHIIINNLGHFVVISKIDKNTITVMDPNSGFLKYTIDEWNKITTNTYIIYKLKSNILKQELESSLLDTVKPLFLKYHKTYIIIFMISAIYTISSIIISFCFKVLINTKIYKINYIFILLILLLILKEISNLFKNNLINYINHSLDITLIKEIFHHLIRLPYLYFKNHTKGDIVTRIKDIFKIRDFISKLFVSIFIDLIFIIMSLLIFIYYDLKIGLLIILISIIYIIIVIIHNNIIYKKIKLLKKEESMINNYLIESISSIDTIKGMNIESMLDNKLDNKYTLYQDKSFSLNKVLIKELSIKNIISNLGLIFIIYFLLNNNSSSNIIFYYSLYLYYFEPINNISSLHLLYKDAKISFLRIKELLNINYENLEMDTKSISKHILGNININNLKYSYNNIDDILKCNKLNIKSSEKVLLYGKSGSGKSTLMKLIVRYLDNYNGDILIDNRNLNSYNLLDIRRKITYVSQDEILYSDTIYNNIVLNNNVPYERYLEIINMTGVSDIINRSILKDEMILDNSGNSLSGGEKQRIILARSLVKNSDIYIFDESMNALDIKNERNLLEKIFSYLKNKTVIVISHRFNNRDLYNKFILVEKGETYEY